MIELECLADKIADISIGEIHMFCRLQGEGSVSNPAKRQRLMRAVFITL